MNDSGNTTETIPLGQRLFERPFLLLVVGYPAADATVPQIGKKELADFTTFI